MSKKTGKAVKAAAKMAKTAKDKAARAKELKRQRDARYRAKKRQEKANANKARKDNAPALKNALRGRIEFVVERRPVTVQKILKCFMENRIPMILKEIIDIATVAYNKGGEESLRLLRAVVEKRDAKAK